ncbi:TetR/AcrR family transcriptional regulator [Timonella senegalensis]|uniref:TetR/AcrR family transcriptional regulator n=1 Tax=Timonella senegalensis TaxID=1465825 RepID=UPI0028A7B142|nr:helix-turn-helix domain-containing protein [Timonella senegalensis]
MEKSDLTRREQNRIDAYRAIHRAAYRMTVIEESEPTVEEIAAEAGVSQRTFFNYFRSKEDAVFGLRSPRLTVRQAECLTQQDAENQLDTVVVVLFGVIRESIVDRSAFLERAKLLKAHASFRLNISRHIGACEGVVIESMAVEKGLDPQGPHYYSSLDERTRAMIILAGSVARYTFITHPDAITKESSEHVRAALEVFRQVMKETK